MPEKTGFSGLTLACAVLATAGAAVGGPWAWEKGKAALNAPRELRVRSQSLNSTKVKDVEALVTEMVNEQMEKFRVASKEFDDALKELSEAQKKEDASRATRIEAQAKVTELQAALMELFSKAASEGVKEVP